ncbi:MarR family winged helix-turn-helix transcriptional regulator [Chryseosolibacter indicus]|uniref:Winged helix DNA-binding protein n=1 Tax=Chryseosolibacter indicus TaxID=2782351 RepID=A0ABS5VNU3_9BACT|nr:MarR family transcriptional regulator [Chryseosolibacter indicus]MBT1702439.1 winged helix DNA-binding protein [Chryseosolibacter indicus]
MSLDKKLKDTEFIKRCSWGKLINYLKRQFDQWVTEAFLQRGITDFKIAYLPFIMNIDNEGTNNNDMAKRAKVTKQAMSKVAKELQELGYIQSKVDATDKRSTIFILTDKGKKFVVEARLCMKELMDEYRKVIGKGKFDALLETLLEIIEYNDKKLSGRHE